MIAPAGARSWPAPRAVLKSHATLQRLLRRVTEGADELSDGINAGQLTPVEWHNEMVDVLRVGYTAAYLDGRGATDLTPGAEKLIGRMVGGQVDYLNRFLDEVERDGWNDATMRPRARMYAASVRQAYERGATFGLPLDQVPGDGKTRCVATPHSRVLTARGLIPIRDVCVGDSVYTHCHRWRRVIATHQHRAIGQRLAYVQGCYGDPVGFTSDHLLYTPDRWVPVEGIAKSRLSVYNISISQDQEDRYADGMSNVRGAKRPAGERMPIMWHAAQGIAAVEQPDNASDDQKAYCGSRKAAPETVGGDLRSDTLDGENRWSQIHVLLGGRHKAVCLPLSVALDRSIWADSARDGNSSQGWESGQRRSEQYRVHAYRNAQFIARARIDSGSTSGQRFDTDRRGGRDLYALCAGLCNPQPHEAKPILFGAMPDCMAPAQHAVGMRNVRTIIQRRTGAWAPPEILFAGMLSEQTTLYDLTVDEDHSFIVEGIVAHNCLTNCRCRLRIKWLDEEELDADVYWELGAAEHCDDCVKLSKQWRPLRVRGGEIV